MNQPPASGPCGLSIVDIIALAAHQRRLISGFGILPTDEIVGTLCTFGEELTRAWREAAGEATTCDFSDRYATEFPKALRALTTSGALKRCRSIGWSDMPSTAADDDMSWFEPMAEDVNLFRFILDASPVDMLDLLTWTQAVLMVPKIIGDPPSRTSSASRGSGRRRERRMARSKRNRR